jgi:hypothetical protein
MSFVSYLILLSVIVQVGLTFAILLKMRAVRYRAIKDGQVRIGDIAVNHAAWPDNVRAVQNNYANQFELPVLFYVAVLLVLNLGFELWLFAILCWAFVASRIVHALIHTGDNHVPRRFMAFLFGFVVLALQWLYILFYSTYAFILIG